MKGTNWNKPTTIGVVLFLIALMFLFANEVEAKAKVEVYAKTAFVGGEPYNSEAILFSEKWNDDKYQVGLGLITRFTCKEGRSCLRGEDDRANQVLFVKRNAHYKRFFMSIGLSYWAKTTPSWNSHTPFTLGMGFQINDHFSINYTHFSTGGASTKNGGLDFFSIGYDF